MCPSGKLIDLEEEQLVLTNIKGINNIMKNYKAMKNKNKLFPGDW